MNNKQVLSAVLTAIMVLSIAASMAAATDDSGCSIEPGLNVQLTNDPLSNRIDDLLDETPVFLFFYADWCPYCHQQMPIVDQLEEDRAGGVTFIRINVTARPDHAAEFNVSALPTMIVVSGKDEDGYLKEEISGFAKRAELSATIAPGEGDKLGDDVGVMAPLATSTTCNSCEDCTDKLKSGKYDVVTLTTDITDHKGSCIGLIMGESDVVFDCDGHTIDGDDFAIDPEHGVTMMHGTGNTIKNCVISDFSDGIYLWAATDHEITGNTMISNDEGIEMGWSDSNNVGGNTVNDNYNGIVLSNSNSNTIDSNTVCKNTNSDFLIGSGTGNSGDEDACDKPDGWNDAGTTGCTDACSNGEHTLDQAQEGTNYGFLFSNTPTRWQEFRPAHRSLARVDLYIQEDGTPGDLHVSVKDQAGDAIWETVVAEDDVEASGWTEILVTPSISVEPESSYYIYVWSDVPADPDNRYYWRGQIESDYDRGISSVESGWPGFDFAFRTWSQRPPWQTQTVDGAYDVGLHTSLALDPEDHPHISYYDAGNQDLKYAYRYDHQWISETVDSAGTVGTYTSLALDSDHQPHVSYCSEVYVPPNNVAYVEYARYDGSAWISETVGSAGTGGGYTSLALDSLDHPHVSYYDGDLGALRYATFDGSKWISETVDGFVDNVGKYTSLALDENDVAHISYVDVTNHDLKYARWYKGDWQIHTVDSDRYVDGATSLALDSDGSPRISYHDARSGALCYAVGNGTGKWKTGEVDSAGDVGQYNSLDLDIDDHAHISYYNTTDGDLKVASFSGTQWISETVDNGGAWGDVGEYVSLALDSIGNPHVSYYHRWTGDVFVGDLKYAEFDVTAPTIISGPVVISRTQETALIAWETDEVCDGVVRYGSNAGVYDLHEQDPSLVETHQLTLTGLDPSTVYHYLVRSTDAAGNTVVSEEGFFETDTAPDAEPPTISSLTFSRIEGPCQFYKLTAPVSDNVGVEKVEFYLDGELIGVDYSGSAGEIPGYNAYLDPAGMGMTREDFFKSHDLRAVAYDKSGLTTVIEEIGVPSFEPPNGELEILSPPPDYTLYFDDSVVPEGTSLDIEVYASEYEYDCLLGGSVPLPLLSYPEAVGQVSTPNDDYCFISSQVFTPPWCHEVARAVEKVEFYIDIDGDHHAERVHTWIPSSDDDLTYTYSWDVGGLGPRSYYTVVKAYLSDGRELWETRHIEIAREGIAVEREVVRYENFYQVSLEVVNEGTFRIQLDEIMDNLASFQAIRRQGDDFDLTTHYSISTQQCLVTIDFFSDSSDTITLDPGESYTVAYLAVPIRQVSYVAFPSIGADEVQVRYMDHSGSWLEEGFDRHVNAHQSPVNRIEAIRTSDYLIVTNPQRLFYLYSAPEEVDKLLSTMAELAKCKDGILGYLSATSDVNPLSDSDVDGLINWWGACMKGSDGTPYGYLSNGYLLLVGETEIIPAGYKYMESSHLIGEHKVHVDYTDMYYANTGGNSFNPELMVGRIIGNDATKLRIPIETSIKVHKGDPSYSFDRSDAFILSGWRKSRNGKSADINFISEAHRVRDRLTDKGTNVAPILDTRIFSSKWDSMDEFFLGVPGSDIIHLVGHGNFDHCDDLSTSDFYYKTQPFGSAKPFVYASSCLTGRYGDFYCLGEAFLEKGAGAYLGSTEISYCCANKGVAKKFYSCWDPGESIGSVLKEVKQKCGAHQARHPSRYYEDVWTAEYQLYGDPKYGLGVFPPSAAAALEEVKALSEPQSSLEVIIPDYEVSTEEGEDYVDIPGGSTMFRPDKPLVPVYDVYLEYPQGYRVQDVILTDRSGLTTDTGLNIPNFTPAIAGEQYLVGMQTSPSSEWWPETDFDWGIQESYDGSSTLAIRMYPFYYNPQTSDVKFYKNYSFDIEVITSTVEVQGLETDEDVYAQGDDVSVDLWLKNSGDPQDVIVDVVVLEESSCEVIDGLMLESLDGLSGLASFDDRWGSTGVEPGKYAIAVEVRDSSGNVLDRAMEGFELGISSGEIINLTAIPECFDIGDEIEIEMAFENTGTVNITGTAIVKVLNSTGHATEEFRHNITDLTPSESVSFSDTLDTSGAEVGSSYRVIGYVLYNSKSTDPETVPVRNMIMGDLNRDGVVTTADAAIALRLAARGGWDPAADVSCDERVTSLDALMILQAAADGIEIG